MKKTLTVNLAGNVFHIDEDAFATLENYLYKLKRNFSRSEGGEEIIADIEARIAELFRERLGQSRQVVEQADVSAVIQTMGQPEDLADDEEDTASAQPPPEGAARGRRVYRDPDDRILGGVASGLAAYFGIDPLWLRLILALLFLTMGTGILLYLILWVVIPKAETTADKLRMRGEPVNISNIQRSIRDEVDQVEATARRFSAKARQYDYESPLRRLGKVIRDILYALGRLLKVFFEVLFKLIGLLFLAAGTILLISLVVAYFTESAQIMGSTYSFEQLLDFAQIFANSEAHYNVLLIGTILSVLGPLLLIIYLGVRILFQIDPLNHASRILLVLITFSGFVMLSIAGVQMAFDFDEEVTTSQEFRLPEHQEYRLVAQTDSLSQFFRENHDQRWRPIPEGNAFNLVQVDVVPSRTGEAYLEVQTTAHGSSRMRARKRAERLSYAPEVLDSVLRMPLYFRLEASDRYRLQRVRLKLYLPEGRQVYLDSSIAAYLYDIENMEQRWDHEMAGHRWKMMDKGLQCLDCTDKPGRSPDSNDAQQALLLFNYSSSGMSTSAKGRRCRNGFSLKAGF